MDWQPISSDELKENINSACVRMDMEQKQIWEQIRITPEKWIQHPWGDLGGGFWVVAITGKNVIWYNDIEEGFNCSSYTTYGTIAEYWCNQDDLDVAVQQIINTPSSS